MTKYRIRVGGMTIETESLKRSDIHKTFNDGWLSPFFIDKEEVINLVMDKIYNNEYEVMK